MPISRSPILLLVAAAIGTIFLGFGLNAILRPAHALTFFEFARRPVSAADQQLVDSLMIIYGARDIFMGLAINAAAFFGSRKTLGAIVLASSAVALVDGAVCKMNGDGEWAHWGYAPMVAIVGALLLGPA